jgi:hypothetical protein
MPGRLTLLLALLLPALAFAQADISLQVGLQKYSASGAGECKHAPRARIYDIPAALYSVSQRGAKDSLNLSVWQPADGKPNMVSLNVTAGGKSYVVDTVKNKKGSGKAVVESSGRGGTITLDAVAASGEKITGKIQCRSFGGVQAEGG